MCQRPAWKMHEVFWEKPAGRQDLQDRKRGDPESGWVIDYRETALILFFNYGVYLMHCIGPGTLNASLCCSLLQCPNYVLIYMLILFQVCSNRGKVIRVYSEITF